MGSDDAERKRLRKIGRDLVEENSRRIHAKIAAENPAPIGSPAWLQRELEIRREAAAARRAVRSARYDEPPATTLADRAFQLARKLGAFFPGPAEARKQLAAEFPAISSDPYARPFFEVYDAALALLTEAGLAADAFRDGELDEAAAVARLAERCPGFAPETYDAAFAVGLFRTR